MKILIVSDFKERIGGVEIYNSFFKKEMEKRGHQVKIIGGKKPRNKADEAVKNLLLSFFSLKWKKTIEQQIVKFKPDIVFLRRLGTTNISPTFLPFVHKKNIPTVVKVGNLSQFSFKGNMMSGQIYKILYWPKKIFHRQLIKKYCHLFIAPSRNTSHWLKEDLKINPKKISFLLNPTFMSPTKKPKRKNGHCLLFVGRLCKDKGLEYLIRAAFLLNQQGTKFQLRIVGKGNKDKFKQLAQSKKLEKVVKFKGQFKHHELKQEYRRAAVFVLPSIIAENSPLTIPEALSQGTPVVTTNIGGQKDLICEGKTGFLVEPRNAPELAEKLTKLLIDKRLQYQMSKNCLQAAHIFSLEEHIKKIENLFQSLINNK